MFNIGTQEFIIISLMCIFFLVPVLLTLLKRIRDRLG